MINKTSSHVEHFELHVPTDKQLNVGMCFHEANILSTTLHVCYFRYGMDDRSGEQ